MPIYHPDATLGKGWRIQRIMCPKGDGQLTGPPPPAPGRWPVIYAFAARRSSHRIPAKAPPTIHSHGSHSGNSTRYAVV